MVKNDTNDPVIIAVRRFPHFHTWSPPPSGLVKVNMDAHVAAITYRGLGAMIWDDKGAVLVAG